MNYSFSGWRYVCFMISAVESKYYMKSVFEDLSTAVLESTDTETILGFQTVMSCRDHQQSQLSISQRQYLSVVSLFVTLVYHGTNKVKIKQINE